MSYYPNTWIKYSAYIRNLGLWRFFQYWIKRRTYRTIRRDFILTSPLSLHPLHCRPRTSDIDVFKQIFAQHEYSCLVDLSFDGSGLVIDCGANAGFSTSYLLSQFPQSTVLAVEPDPGNFAALRKNVLPYGERVKCFQAAVWSKDGMSLNLSASEGDGREWARTVNDQISDSGKCVPSLTVKQLLDESGHSRIRLLKIDIEGAELEVFGESSEQWLPYVDCIVIELHGEQCEELFIRRVSTHGFTCRRFMELTIAER